MSRPSGDENSRFTMNLPPRTKARHLRAATRERTSQKDFMLRNSLRAADEVIDQAERIALSDRDTKIILDLLQYPRQPNPNLIALLRSRVVE